MSEFDPTKFLGKVSPPVADDIGDIGDPLMSAKAAENRDSWDGPAPAVAGVAIVAEVPASSPFAEQLNAMFRYPRPPWIARASMWARLCEDARAFSIGKCAAALEKGWDAIDLYGFDALPWRRAWTGRQMWGTLGLVALLRGRSVNYVGEHRIEIVNKIGPHNTFYRGTAVMNRHNALPMWEAFDPARVPPDWARPPPKV